MKKILGIKRRKEAMSINQFKVIQTFKPISFDKCYNLCEIIVSTIKILSRIHENETIVRNLLFITCSLTEHC